MDNTSGPPPFHKVKKLKFYRSSELKLQVMQALTRSPEEERKERERHAQHDERVSRVLRTVVR